MTRFSHPAGSAANNDVAAYIKRNFEADLGAHNVHEARYRVLLSRPNATHPNTATVLNSDGSTLFDLQNREFAGQFDSAYFAYAPKGVATVCSFFHPP